MSICSMCQSPRDRPEDRLSPRKAKVVSDIENELEVRMAFAREVEESEFQHRHSSPPPPPGSDRAGDSDQPVAWIAAISEVILHCHRVSQSLIPSMPNPRRENIEISEPGRATFSHVTLSMENQNSALRCLQSSLDRLLKSRILMEILLQRLSPQNSKASKR